MKQTGVWLLPDDANAGASVPLAPPPFSSVIPTFLICHPDRSEMIRNADRFAEWRDLLFPSLWWKPNDLPTFLICHPDRSEMIRNADRFAEWRDLLLPSLWWKPKHLRMLAPWACHQFSCADLPGSTGLQAGELPSLRLSS